MTREIRNPAHGALHQIEEMKKIADTIPRYDVLIKILTPTLTMVCQKSWQTKQTLAVARMGLALEQYRRERGGDPETLQALVPDFLPELPVDMFSGKPLR